VNKRHKNHQNQRRRGRHFPPCRTTVNKIRLLCR